LTEAIGYEEDRMKQSAEMIRELRLDLSEGLAKVGNWQSPFVRRLAFQYARDCLHSHHGERGSTW
jgi:hypothetical protein